MAKLNMYEEVTNRVLAALEAGTAPWRKSWKDTGIGGFRPPIRSNGEQYKGVNTLILWIVSQEKGYRSHRWMTYKQAASMGGTVRKGEKATHICYFSVFTGEDKKTGKEKKIPFLKSYCVFNGDQVEWEGGSKYAAESLPGGGNSAPSPEKTKFFEGLDFRLIRGEPAYMPLSDTIRMPAESEFESRERYLGTLSHELVHWTGAPHRLNRDLSGRFGDNAYGMEELTAELGSAFVCGTLGIPLDVRDNASYLASWIRTLKTDSKAIFTVASAAAKAADFLTGTKAAEEEKEEAEAETAAA